MKFYSSCKDAINACLSEKNFAIAHLYNDEKPMAIHIHDCYEIYYSISGGKQFLIDNHLYNFHPGDIFFINQFESHYLTQIDHVTHERIIVSIWPEYLKKCCTPQTDLNLCFSIRNTPFGHRLSLTPDEQGQFLSLIHRLSGDAGFGQDILERSCFLELMTFLNRCFLLRVQEAAADTSSPTWPVAHSVLALSSAWPAAHSVPALSPGAIDVRSDSDLTSKPGDSAARHAQIDQILSYVNQNLTGDLSITALAGHFYISSSYLCKLFRDATGTTINRYITAKRITRAKELLSLGCSVTEACAECGYNDYSNFLRSFTKSVGISPKKYAQRNIR